VSDSPDIRDITIDEFGQPLSEARVTTADRKAAMAAERAIVAPYWGGFQSRIVVTFILVLALWVAIIALGSTGHLALWIGALINTVVATMFYMPLHEAVHGNISGRQAKYRTIENLVGALSSIPLGISFATHRPSHLRHHAFTNDPDRDPDHFTFGRLIDLPMKWFFVALVTTFLPVFAFIPAARKILPQQIGRSLAGDSNRASGLLQLRFWLLTTLALVLAIPFGLLVPALLLWYLPSRIQALWLLFIFAWYPHHPASDTGRYVDTRIAVFPGSRFLIRGHDHHALHHLYPQVPHYRLRALWQEMAEDLIPKGVRAEGRALGATGPVVW
jgi:beta-carotene hydroxylase